MTDTNIQNTAAPTSGAVTRQTSAFGELAEAGEQLYSVISGKELTIPADVETAAGSFLSGAAYIIKGIAKCISAFKLKKNDK